MLIETCIEKVKKLQDLITKEIPELKFEYQKFIGESLFKDSFRNDVPAEGISKKSGIYFITDAKDKVLYIGKAASNNLGAEIWSKFRAPTQDTPLFKNSSLAKYAPSDDLRQLIISGNVKNSAITIDPQQLCSLVEVYLQTMCFMLDGELPPFNKQIG